MWFLYICGVVIWGLVWGYATMTINENKGYEGGFWLGFFLSFIGCIIVACKPTNPDRENHFEKFNQEKFDNEVLRNGGWKCFKCGRINAKYVTSCHCGVSIYENQAHERAASEEEKKKATIDLELANLNKLKAYKDLLDSGVITQDEFDKKKAEILK